MSAVDDGLLARKIIPGNFARALVLEQFIKCSRAQWEAPSGGELHVLVVGGSRAEPEVLALEAMGFSIEVRVVGIGQFDDFLDLNVNPMEQTSFATCALPDLVLCSQVLEHVWNHRNFFDWMRTLCGQKTFLWLAAPAANRPHGSPDYYSAGFTPQYLAMNLKDKGFKILNNGSIGSERLYVATMTSPVWLSVLGHHFPPFESFRQRFSIKEFVTRVRKMPGMLPLVLRSPKVRNDIRYATESWVWAQGTASL